MLQVLDKYRKRFERETGKSHRTALPGIPNHLTEEEATRFLTNPAWDYVVWLEATLQEYENAYFALKEEGL